jgi:hypothetical protein
MGNRDQSCRYGPKFWDIIQCTHEIKSSCLVQSLSWDYDLSYNYIIRPQLFYLLVYGLFSST